MVKKLPRDLFLQSFSLVPRVALDLLLEDQQGRVLLTKRAKQPYVGIWHIPGSFLLKDETINSCIKRVAKNELTLEKNVKSTLAGVFENLDADPRGHVIDIIYKIVINEPILMVKNEDTEEMQFFEKLPANIGFNHREVLEKLGYR